MLRQRLRYHSTKLVSGPGTFLDLPLAGHIPAAKAEGPSHSEQTSSSKPLCRRACYQMETTPTERPSSDWVVERYGDSPFTFRERKSRITVSSDSEEESPGQSGERTECTASILPVRIGTRSTSPHNANAGNRSPTRLCSAPHNAGSRCGTPPPKNPLHGSRTHPTSRKAIAAPRLLADDGGECTGY